MRVAVEHDLIDGVAAGVAPVEMVENCELSVHVELLVEVSYQHFKIAAHRIPSLYGGSDTRNLPAIANP